MKKEKETMVVLFWAIDSRAIGKARDYEICKKGQKIEQAFLSFITFGSWRLKKSFAQLHQIQ